ncbi:transposase [Actinospica sp.]|uniref:transposase n=1 Tax=Actinospica sp. TaxID=1872142 RepID=UPI002CA32DD0|nr:transposase [Actinospica sp.]HWG26424.1 transposase [Actinospica sp.]
MPRPSKYTEEFRRDAVALVKSSPERTVASIARELGVNHETLRQWVKAADEQAAQQFTNGPFEGDSTVVGTIHGLPITGQAYAEQFGNWS